MSKEAVVLKTLKNARTQRDHEVGGLLYDIKGQVNNFLEAIERAISAHEQRKELTKSIDKEYENS